jgi:hypothetical protein
LYSSTHIFRAINLRLMRWAGLVAGAGEKRDSYRILVGKPEDLGLGGRITLKCAKPIGISAVSC